MRIREFFSNRTETSEKHPSEELKTHYYKTTKQQAMRTIKDMIEADSRIELLGFSEEHGEITAQYLKPKKAFLVISVIMVFPYRTAIDLTITTKTTLLPVDWGFSKKEVLQFYDKTDKEFEIAGVGLGGN